MASRECFHCQQVVEDGDGHDCWTTIEAALTKGLSDDLREAWKRLRETAADFGDQRGAEVARLRDSEKYTHFEITLTEGRNRQVRWMVEALDSHVLKLVRVKIGTITIGTLQIGTWRELTANEVAGVRSARASALANVPRAAAPGLR